MAVLPTSNINLGASLQVENEPSRTWYIDKLTNRIQGECDGFTAIQQAVRIILSTDRFKWQIFQPYSGTDYENLIGLDIGYVAIEVQRRIRDALSVDSRVIGISDFNYAVKDGTLSADFVVNTVYGNFAESMEVVVR